MEQFLKSLITSVILVIILLAGLLYANNIDPVGFCEEQDCYMKLIEEKKDPNICDESKNSSLCYYESAFLLGDPELCEKTDKTDKCFFDYAFHSSNPDICEHSQNTSYCYYSLALNLGESDLCDKSEGFQEQCLKKLINES